MRVAGVRSFFCARESERAEFDRNSLIDGSDSDLNWLFSAPITGYGMGVIRGEVRAALPNIGRKSHLIRKSDENGDLSGSGRFLWLFPLASEPSRVTSNQMFQVRSTPTLDAHGKLPFDGRFRLPHPPRRRDVDIELKIASSASKI